MQKETRTSLRLPPWVHEQAVAVAKKRKRSLNSLIALLVEEFLEGCSKEEKVSA